MNKLIFAIFCLCLASYACGEERTVDVTYNPNCDIDACKNPDKNGSFPNLLYVKLTGASDIVHMLYSNIGSFSILLFKTSTASVMNVNWESLLSENATERKDSIKFTDKVLETSGYEVASIFEFDDKNGDADMTKVGANETYAHKTSNLVWKKTVTNKQSSVFEGSYPNSNGSFKFEVRYPGKDERDTALPHLLLTPSASSIEFTIDGIEPRFNMSKFGINIIYLTNYDDITVKSIRTIDDEYTPGTFKLWNAEIVDTTSNTHNFLQWKPIFYYYGTKTLENSTITKQYDLVKKDVEASGIGLVFFDSDKKFSAMNVSYGLQGNEKDGYFYKQTFFSSWTFSVGIGKPPLEKMSFVVTIVIIAGFGLPALVIVVGIIVMVARKFRRSRSQFSPLD